MQRRNQFDSSDRFRDVGRHARLEAFLFVAKHGVCGQSNDWHALVTYGGFKVADCHRRFNATHDRHCGEEDAVSFRSTSSQLMV